MTNIKKDNYFIQQNKTLINYLISDWRRLASCFLQISNNLSYLDVFYNAGLNITHLLNPSDDLNFYQKNYANKADFIQAKKTSIPNYDDTFEYCAIIYNYDENFTQLLKEVFRLTAQSVIIIDYKKNAKNILDSINIALPNANIEKYSTLFLPQFTWTYSQLHTINSLILPISFGSVVAYKINFTQYAPTTDTLFVKATTKTKIETATALSSNIYNKR